MKEMNKAKIIDKKSDKSVKSERDLLSRLNHPFIINMHYSFQDIDNLYLVMDLLTGGDLRYHICKKRYFTEDQTKFFISCILLGLEYCHYYKIIHRDIKPENLVLDSKGYVHITDFGIAKIQTENNKKETSGTPGYMSPEVLCGQNHTIAVDYFALGVMGYEFMLGVRPYLGKSRKEIKEKVMAKQAIIHKEDINEGWSLEAADCINKLLQRKPAKRLGVNGAIDVKKHIWFKNYPWNDLYNNKLISPFIPPGEDNFDYKYCNKPEQNGLNTKERYLKIKESFNYKIAYNDFYYFDRDEEGILSNNNKIEICKNPHLVYLEENEGGSNDNDASIINRNIFSNKSTDDEIYHEIKKNPINTSFTFYKLYGKKRNKNSFLMDNSLHLNNYNDKIGMNSSFKNSFFKKSKASGFGY